MDEHTISPAGDPFTAFTPQLPDEPPHGCYEGVVYIGHMVEGEDGEEVEAFEAVPCRRCSDSR